LSKPVHESEIELGLETGLPEGKVGGRDLYLSHITFVINSLKKAQEV
jgi:hypothetical protein